MEKKKTVPWARSAFTGRFSVHLLATRNGRARAAGVVPYFGRGHDTTVGVPHHAAAGAAIADDLPLPLQIVAIFVDDVVSDELSNQTLEHIPQVHG